jgi:hypothetical protein
MRLYIQPVMSTIFAVRDGMKDARANRDPYFWGLFIHPDRRAAMLRDGWRSVGKIFILAIILDVAYQIIVLRALRPVEGLIVAAVLALVPYLLVRGPVNRLLR